MDLSGSCHLKELPDLSNATNLEELDLSRCESLVEIPSSFSHLQKLENLTMDHCINVQYIPPQLNLASLEFISMDWCTKLRNFSFVSTNVSMVHLSDTKIEDVPALIRLWPRLESLKVERAGNLKRLLTYLPSGLIDLALSNSDIERIPDCIKDLHRLESLFLDGCRRLVSLPELPRSLEYLDAQDCESLETVFSPFTHSPYAKVDFSNCLKLDQKARRAIIKSSIYGKRTMIPGRQVPEKFEQRARGNILTIPLNGEIPLSSLSQLLGCVVLSPTHQISKCSASSHYLTWRQIGRRESEPIRTYFRVDSPYQGRHLFMFECDLQSIDLSEVSKEKIVLKFNCRGFRECGGFDIIECGAYIKTKESIKENYSSEEDQVIEEDEPNEAFEVHTHKRRRTHTLLELSL